MEPPTSALLTDHYELTMVASALESGVAHRRAVFEVFARRLPAGRAYGVVAGIDRVLDAVSRFRFDDATIDHLVRAGVVTDGEMADWLREYRFSGDITGYAEGELFFPYSPVLTVTGSFAECVVLETVMLSVLNHDCAVASAAARMADAAGGRLLIEGGSRRTDPESAVAAARAGFVGGFDTTSNLEAGRRHGIPTGGTTAHAFVLAHADEEEAFEAQRATLGVGSTYLVDTFDVMEGIRRAVKVVGPDIGAIRIDSGELLRDSVAARELLDSLGATDCRIVVSSDLDEFRVAELEAAAHRSARTSSAPASSPVQATPPPRWSTSSCRSPSPTNLTASCAPSANSRPARDPRWPQGCASRCRCRWPVHPGGPLGSARRTRGRHDESAGAARARR